MRSFVNQLASQVDFPQDDTRVGYLRLFGKTDERGMFALPQDDI